MDSLLETLKNLGPGRLAAMLVTFFGLIIFFIFIAIRSSAPSLTLLYGDLSVGDSTEIAAKLDTVHITYRISNDGKQISVPQRQVGKSRMLLAQEGLPRQGSVGYEIFDEKQSFGATSFQQNISQLRALEGELSRTIGTIDQIRSARVHIVMPQRELFSREQRSASASIFLNLRAVTGLAQEQVSAIQHLVAAAVPRLKPNNVAIIDQNGNLLARGEDGTENDGVTAKKGADMRQKYERRLSRSIEDLVGRIVGYGKVRANITADLNFDIISRNSETYDPEGQVIRSTQSVSEESEDNASSSTGAGVTVASNLPGLDSGNSNNAGSDTPTSSNNRLEEVTNYEISKTIETLVREIGQVNKLSIAVLVDGSYTLDTSVEKPEDAEDNWQPPKKYIPRTDDEIVQISKLVKSAAGFDEDRGDILEVINMRFADGNAIEAPIHDDTTIMGFPKADILGVAETVALSLVAVLIILLVLRPLATHIASTASATRDGSSAQEEAALLAAAGGMPPQLAPPGMPGDIPMGAEPGMGGVGTPSSDIEAMINMNSVEDKVKTSSLQKISELVTNHPNETVSVIRQWMSQES